MNIARGQRRSDRFSRQISVLNNNTKKKISSITERELSWIKYKNHFCFFPYTLFSDRFQFDRKHSWMNQVETVQNRFGKTQQTVRLELEGLAWSDSVSQFFEFFHSSAFFSLSLAQFQGEAKLEIGKFKRNNRISALWASWGKFVVIYKYFFLSSNLSPIFDSSKWHSLDSALFYLATPRIAQEREFLMRNSLSSDFFFVWSHRDAGATRRAV